MWTTAIIQSIITTEEFRCRLSSRLEEVVFAFHAKREGKPPGRGDRRPHARRGANAMGLEPGRRPQQHHSARMRSRPRARQTTEEVAPPAPAARAIPSTV